MFARKAKFPESKARFYDDKKQELKYPKTVLQSLDNPQRMAKESLRARLISQLVEPQDPMPREFSSYFLGNEDTSDPAYLVTSHASDIPMQSPVVPTYPLVQTLRWNPYVETSSIAECESQVQFDSRREIYNVAAHKFTCKCRNCTNQRCPSKTQSRQPEKDNIMTFCDKCTMTLKLNSAGCGGMTPVSCTPVISDVSVTSSDVAVRDTMDRVPYHCPMPRRFHPPPSRHHVDSHCVPPILKKPVLQSSYYSRYDNAKSPILTDMEAERDNPEPCYPESPCWNNCKERELCARKSGRTLYNEGILEEGEDFEPCYPRRRSSSVKREKSRVSCSSLRNKFDDDETVIPHSHRHDSKYHYACMEQPYKMRHSNNDEGRRGLVASPRITRKSFQSVQHCKPTSYVLPKRVLTSNPDYNIEKFLQNNCGRMQKTKKKKCLKFFK